MTGIVKHNILLNGKWYNERPIDQLRCVYWLIFALFSAYFVRFVCVYRMIMSYHDSPWIILANIVGSNHLRSIQYCRSINSDWHKRLAKCSSSCSSCNMPYVYSINSISTAKPGKIVHRGKRRARWRWSLAGKRWFFIRHLETRRFSLLYHFIIIFYASGLLSSCIQSIQAQIERSKGKIEKLNTILSVPTTNSVKKQRLHDNCALLNTNKLHTSISQPISIIKLDVFGKWACLNQTNYKIFSIWCNVRAILHDTSLQRRKMLVYECKLFGEMCKMH